MPPPDDTASGTAPAAPALRLAYSAISDVGRVRKDNQDSGYAGPWLLAVADGVGGAARGDIASATAIQEIRKLDVPPTRPADPGDPDDDPAYDRSAGARSAGARSIDDRLTRVAGSLHRAHDRIGELVDQDSSLNGTSTTAVVALFDGHRLAFGHVGDSRAYLLHDGELRQLTTDHTFVQTLIDDGRITPEEARTHPHKNLILKAIDSVHEVEPDLFDVDLVPGDRVLLCSDGVLSLTDARIADILGSGTPDYAAVELVRAALEAGSNDNITCIVADAVPVDRPTDPEAGGEEHAPLLVGSAAELPRRGRSSLGMAGMAGMGNLFRGHRSGDTGELEPIRAEIPEGVGYAIAADPIDPEAARYAPRPPERFVWLRRLMVLAVLVGLLWMAGALAWAWSQEQYYVGSGTDADGNDVVVIYRGLNADLPGVELSHAYQASNVRLDLLSEYQAGQVRDGIDADSLQDAEDTVENLADTQAPAGDTGEDATS